MTGANPFFMGAFLSSREECGMAFQMGIITDGEGVVKMFFIVLGKRQGVLHHSDNVFVSSMARATSSNQHDCGFRGLDPHRPTVPRASLGTKHIHL